MRLEDMTCPECGHTLRYGATYTNQQKQTIQEWFCPCGYEKEVVIKKGKNEK